MEMHSNILIYIFECTSIIITEKDIRDMRYYITIYNIMQVIKRMCVVSSADLFTFGYLLFHFSSLIFKELNTFNLEMMETYFIFVYLNYFICNRGTQITDKLSQLPKQIYKLLRFLFRILFHFLTTGISQLYFLFKFFRVSKS